MTAYSSRIGERLQEVTDEQVAEAATAAQGAVGGGPALLPVLAARTAEVDGAVEQLFPQLRMVTSRTVSDAEGWHSGRAAADRAALDFGRTLPGD